MKYFINQQIKISLEDDDIPIGKIHTNVNTYYITELQKTHKT